MLNTYPDIMTTDDVCELLNISKNHCLALLRNHDLKGFKINKKSRTWKISKVAVIQYLTDEKMPAKGMVRFD